ncbi:MAG: hypothetical protein V1720_18590 [bacterium]
MLSKREMLKKIKDNKIWFYSDCFGGYVIRAFGGEHQYYMIKEVGEDMIEVAKLEFLRFIYISRLF